jgi:hypothetical protein
MERTCARAVKIGLPVVIFTEHLDFTGWQIDAVDVMENQIPLIGPTGTLEPPPLDVHGYLRCIERCRQQYPELRILTGVEFGQPHRDGAAAAKLLDVSELDRVNGSLPVEVVSAGRLLVVCQIWSAASTMAPVSPRYDPGSSRASREPSPSIRDGSRVRPRASRNPIPVSRATEHAS